MVSKREPTIRVKNRLYKVNELGKALLDKWKKECFQKFPLGKKFSIVYADPPWRFKSGNYASSKALNGLATYPTQGLNDIMAMPVNEILTDPAAVFIWTTSPLLYETMKVIGQLGSSFCLCI